MPFYTDSLSAPGIDRVPGGAVEMIFAPQKCSEAMPSSHAERAPPAPPSITGPAQAGCAKNEKMRFPPSPPPLNLVGGYSCVCVPRWGRGGSSSRNLSLWRRDACACWGGWMCA